MSEQPNKDEVINQLVAENQRKDRLLVALEQQRNEALTKNANLTATIAEAQDVITQLLAEIQQLNTPVEEKPVKGKKP